MARQGYDISTPLSRLMSENEITPTNLANSLKISKSVLSEYLRGKKNASYERVELFANYFNVSVNYLIDYDNETKREVEELTINQIKTVDYTSKDFEKEKVKFAKTMRKLAIEDEIAKLDPKEVNFWKIKEIKENFPKEYELNEAELQYFYSEYAIMHCVEFENIISRELSYIYDNKPNLTEEEVLEIVEELRSITKKLGKIILNYEEEIKDSDDN